MNLTEFGARTIPGSIVQYVSAATLDTLSLPIRVVSKPASGIAIIAPSAMESSAIPSAPLLRPRSACTAGMRDAHVANSAPLRKNNVLTAQRAVLGRTSTLGSDVNGWLRTDCIMRIL